MMLFYVESTTTSTLIKSKKPPQKMETASLSEEDTDYY